MQTYQKILRQGIVKELNISPVNNLEYKNYFNSFINAEINNYPYSRIIYIENNDPLVVHHSHSYLPFKKGVDSFNRMLFRLPQINLYSLLFALTIYPHNENDCIIKRNSRKTDYDYLFKEITQHSFGWLVYGYQLEMIYSCLTGCHPEEANEFRKGWNKKDRNVRKSASEIYIENNYSLSNYIEDYAFDENMFCYNANYKGAFLLWKAFNENSRK